MSRAADRERAQKRAFAEPGSAHDNFVRYAKIGFPVVAGLMLLALLVAPFGDEGDVSFILDKNEVATATERMRLEGARYTGVDDDGQPFLIVAKRAIQPTSDVPLVRIRGMAGRLLSSDGPIVLAAGKGSYDLDAQQVAVDGPINFSAPDGYRLRAEDVEVDLKSHMVRSTGPVSGTMTLGEFSAGGLTADLDKRTVTLFGGTRLKIVQGAVR